MRHVREMVQSRVHQQQILPLLKCCLTIHTRINIMRVATTMHWTSLFKHTTSITKVGCSIITQTRLQLAQRLPTAATKPTWNTTTLSRSSQAPLAQDCPNTAAPKAPNTRHLITTIKITNTINTTMAAINQKSPSSIKTTTGRAASIINTIIIEVVLMVARCRRRKY